MVDLVNSAAPLSEVHAHGVARAAIRGGLDDVRRCRRGTRVTAWVEYFVPADERDAERVHAARVSVVVASIGLPFALANMALYWILGSPVAALALTAVTLGLAAVPPSIRRGASPLATGHAMAALTWFATLIVALRSGGFASPAVMWSLLLPLSIAVVGSRRSALMWSALSGALVLGLYLTAILGLNVPQDLGDPAHLTLLFLGYAGVAGAMLALLFVLDDARWAASAAHRKAERALDHQRILDDMHDGVGSNLLGLLVEARAGILRIPDLITSLETCVDDLRLIVDSLDPLHTTLEGAFAALRGRLSSRCETLGIDLSWDVDPVVVSRFDAAGGLHVLRALQEMVTNALRHARSPCIDIRFGAVKGDASSTCVELAVRDHGVGLCAGGNSRGRGMKSLRARALSLGGSLVLEPCAPGLRVALEIPLLPCSCDTAVGGPVAQ